LNPEQEKTRKLQKSKSMEFLKAKLLSRGLQLSLKCNLYFNNNSSSIIMDL